jgi:hypothetical protein
MYARNYILLLLLLTLGTSPQCLVAQEQTSSTLYLKNGSVIRCTLVNVIRDTSITVQTSNNTQLKFSYDQLDSLVSAPIDSSSPVSEFYSKPHSQSKSSTSGLFVGGMIPTDKISTVPLGLEGNWVPASSPPFSFNWGLVVWAGPVLKIEIL